MVLGDCQQVQTPVSHFAERHKVKRFAVIKEQQQIICLLQ